MSSIQGVSAHPVPPPQKPPAASAQAATPEAKEKPQAERAEATPEAGERSQPQPTNASVGTRFTATA